MSETGIRPILIGAGNSLSMTGKNWSWWRRHADDLGIELVTIGTASFARASDVLDAVERKASAAEPEAPAVVDELAEFRAQIARAS